MSLTKVSYSMINGAAANVVDYGADPTGGNVSATTAAFQAAVDANLNVFVPEGKYVINTPITLNPGQNIYGVNGGQFSNGSQISNNEENGGIFWMADGAGAPGQIDGPTITNFTLIADYPIKLNSETALIIDGSTATTPYIMKPRIENCSFKSRVSGIGTGISFSKVFDFIIERCNVVYFEIGIMLQGCDLGRVTTNRLVGCEKYHILEISTGTFGSQNWIENNDLLSGGLNTIYIKSCSRYIRIYNNYLENQQSVGGIDLTFIDCPQYGLNVPATPLGIVCRDNRIDGHPDFTGFVYRLDGATSVVDTVLHDVGTSGTPAASTKTLKVAGDYLPLMFNAIKTSAYDINVPGTYSYTSYTNPTQPIFNKSGISITSANISLCSGLSVNNAGLECGVNGSDSIVVGTGMTGSSSPFEIYLPAINDTILNPLTPGTDYDIYITARSPSSETLNISWLKGAGGSLTPLSLTPSYATYAVATGIAAPDADVSFGVYMTRSTETDNIYIQSIDFVPTPA